MLFTSNKVFFSLNADVDMVTGGEFTVSESTNTKVDG